MLTLTGITEEVRTLLSVPLLGDVLFSVPVRGEGLEVDFVSFFGPFPIPEILVSFLFASAACRVAFFFRNSVIDFAV